MTLTRPQPRLARTPRAVEESDPGVDATDCRPPAKRRQRPPQLAMLRRNSRRSGSRATGETATDTPPAAGEERRSGNAAVPARRPRGAERDHRGRSGAKPDVDSAAELGCSKCRHSHNGCRRCNPNFIPRAIGRSATDEPLESVQSEEPTVVEDGDAAHGAGDVGGHGDGGDDDSAAAAGVEPR